MGTGVSYGHGGAILSDASDNEYLTEGDEQPEEARPEHGAHRQIPHAIEERNLKESHCITAQGQRTGRKESRSV